MVTRLLVSFCAIGLILGSVAAPPASAQQSVNLFVGAFIPHGSDARGGDDVLFRNGDFLIFDMRDFKGVTAGGEYLVGLGDHFDAGLGVGIYSRSSRAVYRKFTHPGGAEIEQDLNLRVVPFTATIRFLPLGHHDAIVPYVGGGAGIYRWQYSETGEFLDPQNNIFRDNETYRVSDTTVGPVILGGVRVPIGSKGSGFGGEIRYQGGKGNLPAALQFAGSKIDLGGFNYLFTVNIGL